METRGEPGTVRRGGAGAAQQAGDGAAGGATTGDGTSTLARMAHPPLNDERRGHGVNSHVDRLNEAIGDGDSVSRGRNRQWATVALFPSSPSRHEPLLL